jgi:prepilin-type processing-associated H-X9-DG protein
VDGGHYTELASYLSSYLELKKTRTKWNGDDVMVCPAFKRVVKKLGDGPVYELNIHVPMGPEGADRQPFGYPNSLYPDVFGTNLDFPPMRLAALADIRDAQGQPAQSATWMLKDADQEISQVKTWAQYYQLPARRVHGKHRNALFFDFHVERVDVGDNPKNP